MRIRENAISLSIFIITSAVVGCLYVQPSYSDKVPDGYGMIGWEMPIVHSDGWVSFDFVAYDPLIDERTLTELRADANIPRSGFFYNLTEGMCNTCTPKGLQPTVDMLNGQIAKAEERTGHVYGDDDVILVIYNFVCTAIDYKDDGTLYGCPEYWATPAETLWAGKGDCEDTAILFVTLCRLYGFDAVIFMEVEHTLAGVVCGLEGVEKDGYVLAECTYDTSSRGKLSDIREDYDAYPIKFSPTGRALAGLCAYLESWGRFVHGIKDVLILPINTEG